MKKFKTENLTAKILSLVTAILLWSYVMGVENPRETRLYKNVRISYEHVQSIERKGLILLDSGDQFVNVKVSGKKSELEKLNPSSIAASVDLEGYGAGESRIRVDAKYESNLGSIQIEDVSPGDIVVKIDKIISKNMPVKILNENLPADNYIVGEITTSTPMVSLKGPQTILDQVRSVETYIDTSDKKESFSLSNPVVALDEFGNPVSEIEINPSVIDISIPIFKTVILPIEITQVGDLPALYTLEKAGVNPATIALKVVNDNNIPTSIKTEEVNLSSLTGNHSRDIKLIIPDGLEAVDKSITYKLDVSLNKYAVKRVTINRDKLVFENVPEGLEVDLDKLPESYTVDLRGLEDKLLNLNLDNLRFIIDLTNSVEGSNKIGLILEDEEGKIELNQEVVLDFILKKAEPKVDDDTDEDGDKSGADSHNISTGDADKNDN